MGLKIDLQRGQQEQNGLIGRKKIDKEIGFFSQQFLVIIASYRSIIECTVRAVV